MDSKTQQRIPPGLIIYKPARFNQTLQNNIKYGFFPAEFDYSGDYLKSHMEKRVLALPMKRYLQNVSSSFDLEESQNNLTLKSLKRIHFFKKIFIRIQQGGRDSRALKQTFLMSSKVTKLELLFRGGHGENLPVFPFQCLSSMNSLKEIDCNIDSPIIQGIQSLNDFLYKTKRRTQREIRTHIDTGPGLQIDHAFNFYSLVNNLERLNMIHQSSSLELDLHQTPMTNLQDLLTFSQSFKKIPNLQTLSINFPANEKLSQFLEALKQNKHLKNLALCFRPSESANSFSALSQFIVLTPSLVKLELNIFGPPGNQSLQDFFENLSNCSSISSLIVNFRQYQNLNDSVLAAFAQSLKRLKALKNLTFWTDHRSTYLTQAGIIEFFHDIAALKYLQKLDLSSRKHNENISDDVFTVLCHSLEEMKELQNLKLTFSEIYLSNLAIVPLSKAVSSLTKLETIFLIFGPIFQDMAGDTLYQLFSSFTTLPILSEIFLEWNIIGGDSEDFCSRKLASCLRNLKGLNTLYLELRLDTQDDNLDREIQQTFQQLQKKFDAYYFVR